jgi:hypothetical protein
MSAIATLAEIGLISFIDVYRQVQEEHPEQTEPFKSSELRKLMWARMAANESGMEKKSFKIPYENLKKTKLQFPYMPNDIRYTGCCAIKKNGDLYTPCCAKTKDSEYCQSCTVDKEGNAKDLPYGSVEDREQNIADGKFTPITYGTWLKKAKKTIDQIYDVLRENGISLVIPAEELETRDVPKNRKGRPAKSDDSAKSKGSKKSKTPEPEEEDGYSSAASSISTKSSQGSKKKSKPSKSKAPEPEPEDEDAEPEPEPVKAKKSKKPKASEPEDDDEPAPKAKKEKKSKKAEPEDEEPKAKKEKKSKKAEEDEEPEPVKAKKSKKPKAEEDEEPKAKKEKKSKAEKAEKPKVEPKAPEPEPEDELGAELEAEDMEEEMETETRIINGKKYMRTGESSVIYDGRGTVVGSVNEHGDWVDSAGEEMVDQEAEFSDNE